MKVLMIFGLKFGSDNAALISLGDKIQQLGHEVVYAHWNDKSIPLPDGDFCIVVHSFGVRPLFDLIQSAPDHMTLFGRFRYVALIDPVADWIPWFWNAWKKFEIPSNVALCDSFQREGPLVPPSGEIKNPIPNKFVNFKNIPASHDKIPSDPGVTKRILEQIGRLS